MIFFCRHLHERHSQCCLHNSIYITRVWGHEERLSCNLQTNRPGRWQRARGVGVGGGWNGGWEGGSEEAGVEF